MTDININIGGLFFLQVLLCVLYYGDYIQIPLWMVWMPALFFGLQIAIIIVLMIIAWGMSL